MAFIPPCQPTPKPTPPRGAAWRYEVKFDGWRVQTPQDGGGDEALLAQRPRHHTDIPDPLPPLRQRSPSAPPSSTASAADRAGRPDFASLTRRRAGAAALCLYLLHLNGRDWRAKPLKTRRQRILADAGDPALLF